MFVVLLRMYYVCGTFWDGEERRIIINVMTCRVKDGEVFKLVLA